MRSASLKKLEILMRPSLAISNTLSSHEISSDNIYDSNYLLQRL